MSGVLSELHFLRPEWLWALLLLLPLAVWVFMRSARAGAWQQWVDPQLQPLVLTQGSQQKVAYKSLWLGLTWLLTTLALAGPTWEQRPTPLLRSEQARLLVLDLSRSMLAADTRPSRLELARLKVRDFLNESRDGKAGLVAFAAQAFPIAPLTDDIQTLLAQVPSLHPDLMPAQGGRIDRALTQALAMLQQGGANMLGGQVILVTDSQPQEAAFLAAQKLRDAGFELSVLAVGTTQGAPIPEDTRRGRGFVKDRSGNIVIAKLPSTELRQLALAGGGRFSLITANDKDIQRLLEPLESDSRKESEAAGQGQAGDQWVEAGPWLLLLLLPLVAIGFRRGWLLSVLLVAGLSPSDPGWAAEADSWWQTPDQQGFSALQQGDADKAAELFESPSWQAAAKYRAAQYAEAAAAWQQAEQPSPVEAYNAGNALAHTGDLQNAMAAWQQVPEDHHLYGSAQNNLELIKQLLEQQQNDQQQGKQNDQNQQEQNQQQNKDEQSSGQQDAEQNGQQGDQQQQNQSSESTPESDQQSEQVPEQPSEQQAERPQDPSESEQSKQATEAEQEENTDEQAEAAAAAAQEMSAEEQAKQQVIDQWLNRVPDDPGGLLREKFKRDYRRRIQQRGNEYRDEEEAW